MPKATILIGDARKRLNDLDDNVAQTCITSPPYWGLRDYGHNNQLGHEQTPSAYISKMVSVFQQVRRVLKQDGSLWLNIGDCYASYRDGKATADTLRRDKNGTSVPKGAAANRSKSAFTNTNIKHKDIVGIPWRLAFALQDDGWYLRQDIIWSKPNPMPEKVRDRCTKSHEYLFLLTKSPQYYFDNEAIAEKAKPSAARDDVKIGAIRNRRSVWTVNTKPYRHGHFAVMPEALAQLCIMAGSKEGDTVLDPFTGAGTTGVVAMRNNRDFVGVEINENYAMMADKRMMEDQSLFNTVRTT